MRGHLDVSGPRHPGRSVRSPRASRTSRRSNIALFALESEGFALRGEFEEPVVGSGDDRRHRAVLLAPSADPHPSRYTQERSAQARSSRSSPRTSSASCCAGSTSSPRTQREGRRGALAVVEQLQGFELAGRCAWEETLLGSRVDGYRKGFLDSLCRSGDVAWARLSLKAGDGRWTSPSQIQVTDRRRPRRVGVAGRACRPSRATPLSFLLRADQSWLLRAARARGGCRPSPARAPRT